jgi:peptide-methionine (S)-S-oxide reductase
MEVIYLGAGCFWCVEAVFSMLKGVVSVTSGYMGGHIKNPSYREVCQGTTGHAEVIKVEYNPLEIKVEDIFKVFWTTHDPTTINRQGADRGSQYRSAIFYTTPSQKMMAEDLKENFAKNIWEAPIVTEIKESTSFYPAEDYHQSFFHKNPDQAYCTITIPPKINKVKNKFSHLLKSNV